MKKDRSTPLKKTKTEPKPGRPRAAGESTFVRLDASTLRRVAARRRTLQEQNTVCNVSQSDVLRALIGDGLDLAEKKHASLVLSRVALDSLLDAQALAHSEDLHPEVRSLLGRAADALGSFLGKRTK